MGHLSMIALGYTINSKQKNVICLDGDGSFLMHLGFTSMVNSHKNFKHIIFDDNLPNNYISYYTPKIIYE